MGTFTSYSDVLPNPSNSIAYDGSSESANEGYVAGPGYASVRVESAFKTMKSMTNSGALISRSKASHSFKVSITYNPLTETEFNTVYSFILEKQGMLKPFFVPCPQYDESQDTTLMGNSPQITFAVDNSLGYDAGVTKMLIDANGDATYSPVTDGQLRPGDLFTVTDSTDSNHKKAYKITRVETNTDYNSDEGQPDADQLRISFVPPLQKDVSDNSTINYINPKIKVISRSDTIQYTLGSNNLYSFSLSLDEVQ